ncbi:hypothetical protein [Rhodococcoides corynebacterioides]|uniref:hypothetical protein n=1 Tax=Rhodococcoides corynebacterioides TaxID=53972 RepID=UPI001C9AAFDC|nr:hypothetical protein [Rhodococcus corynebacterioides]MBY6351269.1 hypothetical protein [Rhodococcus corynebacterioides]MBY6364964.1 hypothetical protein [Rhodococcus corynebacterioides]
MFVMTVDQRGSRRDVDRVDDVLHSPRPALVRPFERTAGDEIQAVADTADTVLDVALDLVDDGHWSIGIGVGPVEHPLPESTRAGRGPAFESAREAVESAKSAPARIAVRGVDADSAADADAVVALLAVLVARRTEQGRDAISALRRLGSQNAVAEALSITPQAVSQRLAVAGWHLERAARPVVARMLATADRRADEATADRPSREATP